MKSKSLGLIKASLLMAFAFSSIVVSGQVTPTPISNFKDSQILNSYPLLVSYDKTTHIIFPAGIKYVDLGSESIIADKAEGVDNILRVKANSKGFPETTLSVVTGDGKYYSYIVNYSPFPKTLNISMNGSDFSGVGRKVVLKGETGGSAIVSFEDVNMSETEIARLGKEASKAGRNIRDVSAEKNDMHFALHGVYIKDNVIFYKTYIKNKSNLNYDIDFVKFYIRDKEVAKRTAMQELEVTPLYVFSPPGSSESILGKSSTDRVYALQRFTIPDNKVLEVEMFEKNGGRHLRFNVTNKDIVQAKVLK